ncbi:MAG: MarR family winged helix-turn-helix transcriptional regulator [Levilactobacillus sp.]|uniref:MarR family winged helix-turn-helix transcriptional regulator n=1 Tax=Levilactobacillus sp. TaxID=2767919 RepID=UPI00258D9808|nr:MarR family winged helix-turn-helix transcriptional regulator [Levilactobacillus sp.]MCH4123750.1 MarR family winged helix-turn-helix transcriptional regulator [Levilactobacillus sp.]MCI1553848.1 MarR family winged helix-turn-helix transcriptional regulator [Levilactobacillus sp.]MCI1599210.1 MarR family winged helix-turn-helix transcriptional regulator [Levilactobacillus sp.]MCI1606239.1 MarR family winged helix-turn-helix transcriptional regulator [Levilactobacillus sp.]
MTEILRPIGNISRALDAIANREFQQVQLTKGQYLYLVRVAEHPGIILERLTELLKVDRTTASRAVQKLTTAGLLEKRPDAVNHKIKKLFVTARGAEIYPLVQRENQYSNQVALQGFSSAEAQALAGYLQRVEQNVAADWQAVKQGHSRDY